MQVVTMLNAMYTAFDTIIEKHKCYKVCKIVHLILLCLCEGIKFISPVLLSIFRKFLGRVNFICDGSSLVKSGYAICRKVVVKNTLGFIQILTKETKIDHDIISLHTYTSTVERATQLFYIIINEKNTRNYCVSLQITKFRI